MPAEREKKKNAHSIIGMGVGDSQKRFCEDTESDGQKNGSSRKEGGAIRASGNSLLRRRTKQGPKKGEESRSWGLGRRSRKETADKPNPPLLNAAKKTGQSSIRKKPS